MLRNKKGISFITVIIISMVMVFIAVTSSNMLLQDAHIIKHLKRSAQAQELAEAGISDAVAKLLSLGWSAKDNAANFPKRSLGLGTYDVTVIQAGGRVLLSSEGVVSDVSRTVEVEVIDLYPPAMEYSLASGGNLDIKAVQGNVVILGDIHANGNMSLKEQGPSTVLRVQAYGDFTGKATAAGSFFPPSGNVTIDDIANSGGGKPPIPLLNLDMAGLKAAATAGGEFYASSQSFNGATLTGDSAGLTYVQGDATFNGNCSIIGGFVAEGNITLNNGNTINQTHDADNKYPIFVSCGDTMCKLYGLFNTQQGNLVYSVPQVKIRTTGGTSVVLGCVLSQSDVDIVANNDVTLTYFKVTSDYVIPTGVEIVSWNR